MDWDEFITVLVIVLTLYLELEKKNQFFLFRRVDLDFHVIHRLS